MDSVEKSKVDVEEAEGNMMRDDVDEVKQDIEKRKRHRYKNIKYQCPRCGLESERKCVIVQHFKRKTPCPATQSPLYLSETIIAHVLKNRVYPIEKKEEKEEKENGKTLYQTINNYNMINNFISGMDVSQKLLQFSQHTQLDIQDFKERVKHLYQQEVHQLSRFPSVKGFELGPSEFYEKVSEITKISRGDDNCIRFFNIILECTTNTIKIFCDNAWKEYSVDKGIRFLVKTLVHHCLFSYELYLVRKLHSSSGEKAKDKVCIKTYLENYYRFIGCFDILPFVKERSINQIIYNRDHPSYKNVASLNDTDYELSDQCMSLYTETYSGLSRTERQATRKKLLDIVKTNAKYNKKELDKEILNLINVNEEFKKSLIESHCKGSFTHPSVDVANDTVIQSDSDDSDDEFDFSHVPEEDESNN